MKSPAYFLFLALLAAACLALGQAGGAATTDGAGVTGGKKTTSGTKANGAEANGTGTNGTGTGGAGTNSAASADVGMSMGMSGGAGPLELSSGETRFEKGLAVARGDVVIHYGTSTVYADYVEYNPETRDLLAVGHVRIYRDSYVFVGDRAQYNLDTKLLNANDFRSGAPPFFLQANAVTASGTESLQATEARVTTSDAAQPDYYVKAKKVRIYPNRYVVLNDATVYVGTTPVFWFPYIYQGIDGDSGIRFTPGYGNSWGAYLLTQYGIPLAEDWRGLARVDLRTARGAAVGFDIRGDFGPGKRSWVRSKNYAAYDTSPGTNDTAQLRGPVGHNRYRFALQGQIFLNEDLYASMDLNKLSDDQVLRDFFPAEFHENPQPDNVVALTRWWENSTLTLVVRPSVNEFFSSTERVPALAWDGKRQSLFGTRIFYEGSTEAARLKRNFGIPSNRREMEERVGGKGELFDYESSRFDTFHQLLLPEQFFGWLSVVPRVGVRGTWYSRGALETFDEQGLPIWGSNEGTVPQREGSGSVFRGSMNAGVESSFKFSRQWERVQSRAWGLDGLRHVVQPYGDYSFLRTNKEARGILQFDRLNASTQLPLFDFPQFTTLDTLNDWSVFRLGVRNRLETRRDDRTLTWLEVNTHFNYYDQNPNFAVLGWNNRRYSNLFNRVTWTPLPWMSLDIDAQSPVFNDGFSEINTTSNFMVSPDLRFTVGHRFLDGFLTREDFNREGLRHLSDRQKENLYSNFKNSSNIRVGAYYRINDNWGVSFREQYELDDQTLERQDYQIHRDLSSWVLSFGVTIRENRNSLTRRDKTDLAVMLIFTLKDFPNINLPLSFDPSGMGGGGD